MSTAHLPCSIPGVVAWRLQRAHGPLRSIRMELRFIPVNASTTWFQIAWDDFFAQGWHSHCAYPVDTEGTVLGSPVPVPRYEPGAPRVEQLKVTMAFDQKVLAAAEREEVE